MQNDLKIEPLESNINYDEIFDFFNFEGKWIYENSIYNAVESSDAVVILTEWEEYKKINWE